MSTNIGGVVLGDLTLGAGGTQSYNVPINNTITFIQTIGVVYVPKPVITNIGGIVLGDLILGASTVIVGPQVYTKTIISTYSPVQIIKTLKYASATSTITFNQSIVFVKTKPVSVVSTYTPTQTIAPTHTRNNLVISTLNWVHSRFYNAVLNKTVNQTYSPIQTFTADRCKTVNSSLNWTQTISYVKAKYITHHLQFQDQVLLNSKYAKTLNQIYPVFQIINRIIASNQAVTSTLNWAQSIYAPRVLGITHTLPWTQSIVAYDAKSVKNNITFNQSISYNKISNINVTQTLTLNQLVGIARSKLFVFVHGLGFNSIIKAYREFNKTINNVLTWNQEIRRVVYIRSVTSTLTQTQTVNLIPVRGTSVLSTLSFNQSINTNGVFPRSVTSILLFPPTRSVYVGMGDVAYYNIENVQYSLVPYYKTGKKNRPHCVLQVSNAAITLPAPDWNDAENYGGIFTIRRSMNGIPYTHVRSLSLRKLKLPWTLAKRKAWELREFLLQYNASLMTLTTWKGDKWFVNLLTNPTDLTVRGRYDLENEKVSIELEFEGLKVM